jgi:Flp pilus assembly protein TadG
VNGTDRDVGAADVLGVVVLVPALVALAMLVVALGRTVDGRAQARAAVESAAQAAALERTPGAASAAADHAIERLLSGSEGCAEPTPTIDTSSFAPGGYVRVSIRCTVSDRGIETIPLVDRTFTVTAVAWIDPFRAASAR